MHGRTGNAKATLESNAPPGFPDINCCQALKIGFGEWVDCLMPDPQDCPHAVAFGLSFYCTHPNRAEIVARSLRPSILSVRRPIRRATR